VTLVTEIRPETPSADFFSTLLVAIAATARVREHKERREVLDDVAGKPGKVALGGPIPAAVKSGGSWWP
jgi:hypothetical protein